MSVEENIRRGDVDRLRERIQHEGFDRMEALQIMRYLAAYESYANGLIKQAAWVGAFRLVALIALARGILWLAT